MQQNLRVDHQANRHEENCAEHVANGLDQALDLNQLAGFSHDCADQKGSEHHAVFQLHHQQAETEAQPQYSDQQHLVAFKLGHISQQARHQQNPNHQGDNHEQRELADRGEHLAGADRATHRNARQQRNDADTQDVLHNQHAENQLGEPLVFHLQVVEGLDDNGGRGDCQDRAEEQRVHSAPVEPAADLVANPDHQHDFQERRDKRRGPYLEKLAQAEFQAQAEHQEDHPQLRQGLDRVFIVDQAKRRGVGADNEAGNDVAQHHRLLEAVKQDGDHPCHQHDHGQVLDKADGVHDEGLLEGAGAFPTSGRAFEGSEKSALIVRKALRRAFEG